MNKLIVFLLLAFLAIYIVHREHPELLEKGLENIPFTPEHESRTQQQASEIRKHRDRIVELENQHSQTSTMATNLYGNIMALRKTLNTDDSVAVARFNSKVSAYEKVNEQVKEISRQLDVEKQQLNTLLAQADPGAAQAAGAPPPSAVMPGKPTQTPNRRKKVVVYSTSWCPVCVKAKDYLFKKHIFYTEIDVESSPEARAEFKRLGGHGVPLIFIGDTRLDGFSEEEIDKALRQ